MCTKVLHDLVGILVFKGYEGSTTQMQPYSEDPKRRLLMSGFCITSLGPVSVSGKRRGLNLSGLVVPTTVRYIECSIWLESVYKRSACIRVTAYDLLSVALVEFLLCLARSVEVTSSTKCLPRARVWSGLR